MKEQHPDRESYNVVWETVIKKEIENYQKCYTGCIELVPCAEEAIWEKYIFLNRYCKLNYMASTEGKLDRHKVAACYMMAILIVSPMRFSVKRDSAENALALNEGLALTVGLSLVRAFAISAIEENKNLDQMQKDEFISKFESGIKIPEGELVNHGDYWTNFCSELYYELIEGKLSILSLAHELYLLEVITRLH